MIQSHLAKITSQAIRELYQASLEPDAITIQETSEHFEGDFTIILFPLLRVSKKSPDETGLEIGSLLLRDCQEIKSFQVVKGFLNVTLKSSYWMHFFNEATSTERFGFVAAEDEKDPVLVEFSSPNTNKPLHLGHIRNNLIGYAVTEILEAAGERVIRVNLVNDRGIHICKSMIGWMKFGMGKTPGITGIKGDKFVGDFYVAFDKAYKLELAALMAEGLSPEEAEKQSRLMEEARVMLRHWEENEPQTRGLWKQMNDWVYDGFDITYQRLGIHFDHVYYESETYLRGKAMVLEGLQKGFLVQRPDHSVWIDLTAEGMDEKLLLRADGTSVYMTQDIGTALIREEDYHPSGMIYVVGNEQNYHFEVLTKVLARLGYNFAEKIRHLSYGMVELPSGKMKSREGTVVDADDLMDEMQKTARRVTSELGKWSEDELLQLDSLFEMLGTGALKYFILKVDPKKNMLFNPEESIDFNGNTGPFIQYTHARIASLTRKAEEAGIVGSSAPIPDDYPLAQSEINLLKTLYRFPLVIQEAAKGFNPALVANFSYEVAKSFNQFYQALSVLNDEDGAKVSFRIQLSAFTGAVLKNAMGLLGISLPDKM
jgi:arginyl-tRNA synthetase